MSSAAIHGRFRSGPRGALVALGCAVACSAPDDEWTRMNAPEGGFGNVAEPFADAGASADAGLQPPDLDGGDALQVRLLHAIVNLGELYLCHDPDGAEPDAGPSPASLLPGSYGVPSEYEVYGDLGSGVLSLHRSPPPGGDAGVMMLDAGEPAAPCGPDSLEAQLALGALPEAPSRPGDGGVLAPEEPRLETARSVTLVASGAALDEAKLAARLEAVRADYLSEHPGDDSGADQAAREAEDDLRGRLGPQLGLYPERMLGDPALFQLALAHLVADAPVASGTGAGPVRLCVTVGTRENQVIPAAPAAPVAFRERRTLSTNLAAGEGYRFRVFAADAFDASGQDCATTSQMPLAALELPANRFAPGRAYTLAFLGAVTPGALCTPVAEDSVLRSGCARPVEELGPQLLLLDEAP